MHCSQRDTTQAPASKEAMPIRVWHTFNAAETEELNQALDQWPGATIEATMTPFFLGQNKLRATLGSDKDICPDLARVDATWLPGLVADDLLLPVPDDVADQRAWLPEAAALTTIGGKRYGLPQALDGLAIIYRTAAVTDVPWPPNTLDELESTMRTLAESGDSRQNDNTRQLGLRVDGYWFVPFLRAWGPGLLPALDVDRGAEIELGIDSPVAAQALARFASLFGPDGIVPPITAPDRVDREEAQRFRQGDLAVVINGPWSIANLTGGGTRGIAVAPLPQAPRGGQLYVVPSCAKHTDTAWKLALFLTAPTRQAAWSERLGVLPTTQEGLERTGSFARQFYAALRPAIPLPQHPITAELFDDLSPAVKAVVDGDATADEALAGVAKAWRRLLSRHNIGVQRSQSPTEHASPTSPASASSTARTGTAPIAEEDERNERTVGEN